MANGKYTFEDMAAEKSNAQDLLDIYLRNKNPVPVGGSFDWMAHQNQLADYTNKIDQYFNPTPPSSRSQLIEQGVPLGQRRAIEDAAAAELAKSVQKTQQATMRDMARTRTGGGMVQQPRGRTPVTPTSTTPAFDPEVARMMMNAPAKPPAGDIYSGRLKGKQYSGTAPTTDPELTAIQDAATAAGNPFAAADAAGTDIRGRDLSYLETPDEEGVVPNLEFLTAWDTAIKETLGDTSGMTAVEAAEAYETASAQRALDAEIINKDVFDALEVQIATDEGGNINAPIFQWGVNTETGADQIVMTPTDDGTTVDPAEQCALDGGTWNGTSCDFGDGEEKTAEQLCIDQGGTWDGTSCKIADDSEIIVPPEEELTYEQKQKQLSTDTYNDRIKEIEKAVKDGLIDIEDAQTAFNDAKNQLFAQMAALNEATYGTVADEFQARTTQRAADVEAMLKYLTDPVEDPDPVGFGQESDFQAGAGIDRDFIQQIIGDDIAWNMAGYAEETDAMRDFMGALELIGQQGASEAEMLGNYMFDSYRQDLETTGRNMELQSAMQMLAEQQAAAEQNLQSQLLGPYFGLDPEMMMAGMGAGVDMAGYAEGRTAREDAADMAYQDNVWDYLMSQTMSPYQSGMLGVAQQGQQMDTMSTLWDIMNPQPTAAETAAANTQAQMDALNSALAKMRAGGTPAQAPSPANNWMGSPAMPAQDIYTGEEIMAMQDAGMDVGQMMLNQQTAQVEMQNMGSFAEAMNIPLENLMGAQSLGVLKELVDDFQFYRMGEGLGAVSADSLIPFVYPPSSENPEGTMGMVPQSDWLNKFEIFYPDANNKDFQLGEGGPWLSGEMTPQEYFEVATMAAVDAESLQDLLRYFYFPTLAGE